MPKGRGFNFRILVVDDEPSILETSALVLGSQGYEVLTAADGFHALAELQRALPDLIVSDLRMPNMSGFEFLSVVRRRFPHLPVIAISGEYNGDMPAGLIADAFFTKGGYRPDELFRKIAELITQFPLRPQIVKPDKAPVWIPRSDAGFFVVTCTDCLRSFSIPEEEATGEVRESECLHCGSKVRYLASEKQQKSRGKGRASGGDSSER